MTVTGHGLPETVGAQHLSSERFRRTRMPPLLGRVFHQADGPPGEQAQRVVVLTYRFGSDISAGGLRR